jgi:glycosyltransferase involved in cell wall biosynthesis
LIQEYDLENRIVFLGIKQNPYPYIKMCDIYLQPSRHEGKPIAVEEAKILQKPIVVTDYSSAKEQMTGYPSYEIAEISEDGICKALQTMLERISAS